MEDTRPNWCQGSEVRTATKSHDLQSGIFKHMTPATLSVLCKQTHWAILIATSVWKVHQNEAFEDNWWCHKGRGWDMLECRQYKVPWYSGILKDGFFLLFHSLYNFVILASSRDSSPKGRQADSVVTHTPWGSGICANCWEPGIVLEAWGIYRKLQVIVNTGNHNKLIRPKLLLFFVANLGKNLD